MVEKKDQRLLDLSDMVANYSMGNFDVPEILPSLEISFLRFLIQ